MEDDISGENNAESNIAHEIAHCVLWHERGPAFDVNGLREWNAEQEEKAQWLAGALLIAEEAALEIVRLGWSIAEAARRYGTSFDMVRGRVNVAGAQKRAGLAKSRRLVKQGHRRR
jgi:Zn-dependent peptidase ImmA (M78 family)